MTYETIQEMVDRMVAVGESEDILAAIRSPYRLYDTLPFDVGYQDCRNYPGQLASI